MPTSDEYSAKAQEMRRLSAAAPDAVIRSEFDRMAHGWEAMARRAALSEQTLVSEGQESS